MYRPNTPDLASVLTNRGSGALARAMSQIAAMRMQSAAEEARTRMAGTEMMTGSIDSGLGRAFRSVDAGFATRAQREMENQRLLQQSGIAASDRASQDTRAANALAAQTANATAERDATAAWRGQQSQMAMEDQQRQTWLDAVKQQQEGERSAEQRRQFDTEQTNLTARNDADNKTRLAAAGESTTEITPLDHGIKAAFDSLSAAKGTNSTREWEKAWGPVIQRLRLQAPPGSSQSTWLDMIDAIRGQDSKQSLSLQGTVTPTMSFGQPGTYWGPEGKREVGDIRDILAASQPTRPPYNPFANILTADDPRNIMPRR